MHPTVRFLRTKRQLGRNVSQYGDLRESGWNPLVLQGRTGDQELRFWPPDGNACLAC